MARPQPADPAPPQAEVARLSLRQKIVYGFGDLAPATRQTAFQFALLPFFTDVVMLAPWLAGLGKMLGLLWDGVNDPVTGFISDQIFWFDWSNDGKQLACSRGRILNDVVLITESKP